MAVKPTDLILKRLNRIDDRLSRLEGGQGNILEELRAHKSLIAGALKSQSVQEANVAEFAARLDRIERRLEIREAE